MAQGTKKFQGGNCPLPPTVAPMRGEVPNAEAALQLFPQK